MTLLRCTLSFDEALTDRTGGQCKVLRRDYLSNGLLPVIDQGSAPIAGYTDAEGVAYNGPLPVILFGDHTRTLKYVDSPFALGADGVKVLEPAPCFEPKYLYYYLLAQEVPSRGYSRHFKYLKNFSFPLVPPSEQRRIVEILGQADRLRRLRDKAETKADRILPAFLAHLIGSPSIWSTSPQSRALGDLVETVSGATPSKANEEYWNGEVPWISPKDMKRDFLADAQDHVAEVALEETNLKVVEPDNVLIVVRGMILARDVPVAMNLVPITINQDMKALVPKTPEVTGSYLWATLRLAQPLLQSLVRTAGHGTKKLDTPDLLQFPVIVPSPKQLAQVDSAVCQHRLHFERSEGAAAKLQRLFKVLLGQAFDGTLTSEWRKARIEQLLEEMEQQAKLLAKVTP